MGARVPVVVHVVEAIFVLQEFCESMQTEKSKITIANGNIPTDSLRNRTFLEGHIPAEMFVHLLRPKYLVLDDSPILRLDARVEIALHAGHAPVEDAGEKKKE